jgi:chromosome partitioning protein
MTSIIISSAAQKGGAGKTSLAFHLSGATSETGLRTLVCDTDPQHSLSGTFLDNIYSSKKTLSELLTQPDLNASEVIHKTKFSNIDIIPCNLSLGAEEMTLITDPDSQYLLQTKLQEIRPNYDIIIIDTPPNLGPFTRMALVASDHVIIPMECSGYAVKSTLYLLELLIRIRKRANPNLGMLGFVINKLNPTRTIEQTYLRLIKEKFKPRVFQTEIRNSVKYLEATSARKPITHYQPRSEQAEHYRQLLKEIQQRLPKPANHEIQSGEVR